MRGKDRKRINMNKKENDQWWYGDAVEVSEKLQELIGEFSIGERDRMGA